MLQQNKKKNLQTTDDKTTMAKATHWQSAYNHTHRVKDKLSWRHTYTWVEPNRLDYEEGAGEGRELLLSHICNQFKDVFCHVPFNESQKLIMWFDLFCQTGLNHFYVSILISSLSPLPHLQILLYSAAFGWIFTQTRHVIICSGFGLFLWFKCIFWTFALRTQWMRCSHLIVFLLIGNQENVL